MRTLYFTIGLDLKEIPNIIKDEAIIYNIGHMLKMFPEMLGPHGYNKIDLLIKFLDEKIEKNENIVIQGGIENREEYHKLESSINQSKKKNFIKYSDTIEEYRMKWEGLSRWADSVEYHIEREKAWNNELNELAEALKEKGVEVEFIK